MNPSEPIITGRELALRMNAAFSGEDWVALLCRHADRDRNFVEWHLQEDMPPPQEILQAAGELLAAAEQRSAAPKKEGAAQP